MRAWKRKTLTALRTAESNDPPGLTLAQAEAALGWPAGAWLNRLVQFKPFDGVNPGLVRYWHTFGGYSPEPRFHGPEPTVTWRITEWGVLALDIVEILVPPEPPPVEPLPRDPPDDDVPGIPLMGRACTWDKLVI